MDGNRFDAWTRAWGASRSRRGALRLLAGGGLGALLARLAPAEVAAQEAQAVCRFVGEPCTVTSHCCHGNVCVDDRCACRPNYTSCGGRCRDLRDNEHHCGACDTACHAGQTCCRGVCADLRADEANCGRCGNRCGQGEACQGGACRAVCQQERAPCRDGDACCSGSCNSDGTCAECEKRSRCSRRRPCGGPDDACSCHLTRDSERRVCVETEPSSCDDPSVRRCNDDADCGPDFACVITCCRGGRCKPLCGHAAPPPSPASAGTDAGSGSGAALGEMDWEDLP